MKLSTSTGRDILFHAQRAIYVPQLHNEYYRCYINKTVTNYPLYFMITLS